MPQVDESDIDTMIDQIYDEMYPSLIPEELTDKFLSAIEVLRHDTKKMIRVAFSIDSNTDIRQFVRSRIKNWVKISMKQPEQAKFSAPTYEIDLSEYWAIELEVDAFLEELKRLKIYRKGLLYSGLDGSMIGQQVSSDEGENVIFCSTEQNLTGSYGEEGVKSAVAPQNALEYASDYDQPAIAIYDSSKMGKKDDHYMYKIKDPSALLAILILK